MAKKGYSMIKKIRPDYFRLGEFLAKLQINGIIHPDFTLNNLGINRSGQIVISDSSDIILFKYPEELDIDKINRLAKSLFPIIRKRSFEDISWFRLGFVSRGGYISNKIFNSTLQYGLSSFNFTGMQEKFNFTNTINFNCDELRLAQEWKVIDFHSVFKQALTLQDFEKLPMRRQITNINKFYFDLYYLVSYYYLFCKISDVQNMATVLLNLGNTACMYNKIIMAYGLLLKLGEYVKNNPIFLNIQPLRDKILKKSENIISPYKNLIEESIKYDLPQMLWILEDIEGMQ